MADRACLNCAFYLEIKHRGQRYKRGKCIKHFALRKSDKYTMNLSIVAPDEFYCEEHEFIKPSYVAVLDGTVYSIPEDIANELIKLGWSKKEDFEGLRIIITKGDVE